MAISENYDSENGYILCVKRVGKRKNDFNVYLNKPEKRSWMRDFITKGDYEDVKSDLNVILLGHKEMIKSISNSKIELASLGEKIKEAEIKKDYSNLIILKEEMRQKAVEKEDYELAAKLRDEINKLIKNNPPN